MIGLLTKPRPTEITVGTSSGAYLAGTVFHSDGRLSWFPFADWNAHLYATGDTETARTEIVSVTVPRVCH